MWHDGWLEVLGRSRRQTRAVQTLGGFMAVKHVSQARRILQKSGVPIGGQRPTFSMNGCLLVEQSAIRAG